jgi:hypothetical protein
MTNTLITGGQRMPSHVSSYSRVFVFVIAGALGAVFVEHISRISSVANTLYASLDVFRGKFNIDPTTSAALSAATRDIVVVGGVALFCLAICLAMILIHTFSSEESSDSILEPGPSILADREEMPE